MEITGIQETAQFLSVAINGTETFFRITGKLGNWTFEKLQALILLIWHTGQKKAHELKPGEVNIRKLMNICGEKREKLGLIQIDDAIMDDFVNFAKKNKITYSIMADANSTDGKKEIVYSESQAAAFQVFLKRYHEHARPYSFDEYTENARSEDLAAMSEELDMDMKADAKRQDINSEKKAGEKIYVVPADKKDIVYQTETEVYFTVDAGDSGHTAVVMLDKNDILKDNSGNYYAKLKGGSEYKIYMQDADEPGGLQDIKTGTVKVSAAPDVADMFARQFVKRKSQSDREEPVSGKTYSFRNEKGQTMTAEFARESAKKKNQPSKVR